MKKKQLHENENVEKTCSSVNTKKYKIGFIFFVHNILIYFMLGCRKCVLSNSSKFKRHLKTKHSDYRK